MDESSQIRKILIYAAIAGFIAIEALIILYLGWGLFRLMFVAT